MNIRYYLIHNLDVNRRNIMMNEFTKWGFDLNNITWMNHPNRDEISEELLNEICVQEPSYSSGVFIPAERTKSLKGLACCTYKHYLCLKDIIENDYDYGIIIEDNIAFKACIPELVPKYIQQLDEIYGDWDILFDGAWTSYIEGPVRPDVLVYPKTNEVTGQCHGGTKAATFYVIKKECAKKLYDNYIPFNNSPDWWMNDLFRKLGVKSFWVEPSNVYVQQNHRSTAN